ncbi:MerR family transcriptional regulator [Chimaeribacter californicus]|uniref:MerR family transcriptional regulator n=1 Tax=Chimaeribacter californicus TaxID=2060067 RepID=UPI001F4D8C16|nr:MerR family transcriptional regulator [Chimaeribacter californicus]
MLIGELARHGGVTVRTLHHYDALGLLKPGARSPGGYRLYHQNDLVRLHQIQALRRFGLTLADIGDLLARHTLPLHEVIPRQIAMLDKQLANIVFLRRRLLRMAEQLQRDEETPIGEWLATLEFVADNVGVNDDV